jgi:hypothetical protein
MDESPVELFDKVDELPSKNVPDSAFRLRIQKLISSRMSSMSLVQFKVCNTRELQEDDEEEDDGKERLSKYRSS